ncbi:MAG TPA: hypothetical protein VGH66_15065, partial [Acidimicrobiales bacterium]
MTDSIPLADLPSAGDNARRDRWGRYLIVPPAGGKPVPHTRVTTVAKALDSGGGLAGWKGAMTATGLIRRRGLRARWEALVAEYGDPWYHSEASKAACKALVEECAAAGGADDRKEVGTSLHTITALFDGDRAPDFLTEETERDVTAYIQGRAAHHVDIVAGMIEQTVVLDAWQVAGTFDRLAVVPGFDLPLIADLKTGANLDYSWGPIAVQLAAYAHADAIYRQGPAKDGSQDARLPMPAVDQHRGLVFWLDAGTGAFEMFLVDLDAGWEAFEHSMWARGWAKAKVAVPLAEDLVPLLEASIASTEAADGAEKVSKNEPVSGPTRRDWLQDRIDLIGGHDQARADLGRSWPPNLPTLRSSTDHTPEQLDAIERLLDGIERRHELPFGPADPVGRVVALFPGST